MSGQEAAAQDLSPADNRGRPWRIGYLEGGAYQDYASVLAAVVDGLAALGWTEPVQPPPNLAPNDARGLWAHYASRLKSRHLAFVPEAFFSADWDAGLRASNRKELVALMDARRLDLVLAMGTWAGQDLASEDRGVPVVVASVSDPVASGIVLAANRSGRRHLFARCDPRRYRRQLRAFHALFPFKTLGVAYEDSPVGRSYGGMQDVEAAAAELGFTIIPCHTITHGQDALQTARSYLACYRSLAGQAEAVYLTSSIGTAPEYVRSLTEPLLQAGVPTFAQSGRGAAHRGALLALSPDFPALGRFLARNVVLILKGAAPDTLDQIFEPPPTLILNLKAARRIGYNPPLDLLVGADEILDEIVGDPDLVR